MLRLILSYSILAKDLMKNESILVASSFPSIQHSVRQGKKASLNDEFQSVYRYYADNQGCA